MIVTPGTEAVALWIARSDKQMFERLLLTRVDCAQTADPGAVMVKMKIPPSHTGAESGWYFTGWYCAQCRTTFFVSSVEDLHHEPCLNG